MRASHVAVLWTSLGGLHAKWTRFAREYTQVVDVYAKRLQKQERLTRQIGELLAPFVHGVSVQIEAQHLCMMARGVSRQKSTLVTNHHTGTFLEGDEARNAFLLAIR